MPQQHQQNSKRKKKSSPNPQDKFVRVKNLFLSLSCINFFSSLKEPKNQPHFSPICIYHAHHPIWSQPSPESLPVKESKQQQFLPLAQYHLKNESLNVSKVQTNLEKEKNIQKNYNLAKDPQVQTEAQPDQSSQILNSSIHNPQEQKLPKNSPDFIRIEQKMSLQNIFQEVSTLKEANKKGLDQSPKEKVNPDSQMKKNVDKPEISPLEKIVQQGECQEKQNLKKETEQKSDSVQSESKETHKPAGKHLVEEDQKNSDRTLKQHKSIRKALSKRKEKQFKEQGKQEMAKPKSIQGHKGGSRGSEGLEYTCHCNTRGCRDHYCGCYKRGQKCSTSCLCSDCTNTMEYKAQKRMLKRIKEQRTELMRQNEGDLEFGIEFQPACFMGFDQVQLDEKVNGGGEGQVGVRDTGQGGQYEQDKLIIPQGGLERGVGQMSE